MPGAYDFVGVAAHEIGHALGFFSDVDRLDYYGSTVWDALITEDYYLPTTLDLFRFTSLSAAYGLRDFTAGAREQFFSIDGGETDLGAFSTGRYLGDGHQASHWRDDQGHGIMDPTFGRGEAATISDLDLTAFDVIGYDLIA